MVEVGVNVNRKESSLWLSLDVTVMGVSLTVI